MAFAGGSIERGVVVNGAPESPGYGLYVYLLPQQQVPQRLLKALVREYACHTSPVTANTIPSRTALLLFPVQRVPDRNEDPAKALLTAWDPNWAQVLLERATAGPIDTHLIYVVATNLRLAAAGQRVAANRVVVMPLEHLEPEDITAWVQRLRSQIQDGNLAPVADYDLQGLSLVRDLFVGATTLFGAPQAEAGTLSCNS